MTYTPISFTFGQQLTSSQMNTLADNDASFNDASGISTFNNGGLVPISESWSHSAVSGIVGTITVPSGADTRYAIGDWVFFTQNSIQKSFQIVRVQSTSIKVTAGTTFTLTSDPISAIYHSKWLNPAGAPASFAYTTTYTGFSADPVMTTVFRLYGKRCFLDHIPVSSGTSNAGTMTLTSPLASKYTFVYKANRIRNNSVFIDTGVVTTTAGSTTLNVFRDIAGTAFTSSGEKRADFSLDYEISDTI
jgi:hypothetical protein